VLALDLGSRRIGVAVGATGSSLAFPRPFVAGSRNRREVHRRIAALVAEEEAEVVVVGLPRSLDGRLGPAAQRALADIEALRAVLDVPVETHDERLTTVAADRALAAAGTTTRERRAAIDSTAAAVLLESWLATRHARSAPAGRQRRPRCAENGATTA